MTSLVERLRGLDTYGYQSQLACEAADTIEAMQRALHRASDFVEDAIRQWPVGSLEREDALAASEQIDAALERVS